MVLPLRQLRTWLAHPWFQRRAGREETSRLIVGSTGSGKSEGELVDLVRIADNGTSAIVLLDGHGPLALRAAGHWEARGHEPRLLYEPLRATDRVLCWPLLPRSTAASLAERHIDDAETRDEVAQCFLAQRNLATLNDRPWTKEWLDAALHLMQAQLQPEPIASLLDAFRVGTAGYERLLAQAQEEAIVAKFRGMEQLKRRSIVEYEAQTGPARRLLELVCSSEVVRLRCRPGPFNWLTALQEHKLLAFDGGGLRSSEIKRTLFLLVSMHVIHAVRRHFAEAQSPLPVVLVLEEAGALGLVTLFVRSALQELRKAGLAIHLLTQSSLDFGDRALFESLLANTPWQAWYQLLSPADQELGAKVLANATFDSREVHFTRPRNLADGATPVPTVSHGESVSPHGTTLRRDRRTGTAFLTRYRRTVEEHYKSPQLHEQELRTALATLRIGERWVRDRTGVWRERVKPLPPSRPGGLEAVYARAAIARVRQQPLYQPCLPPPAPSAGATPARTLGAAAVLRRRAEAGRATPPDAGG